MSYFLIITDIAGSKERIEVTTEGYVFHVSPGDNVQVVDSVGIPIKADLRPEGEDLTLICSDGREVCLKDFYAQPEGASEITVSLQPSVIQENDYEFNAQVGNLPGLDDFTLMRLSNTQYLNFQGQLDDLNRDVVGDSQAGGGGGGGGNNAPSADSPLDTPPGAVNDFTATEEGQMVNINLLGNDQDPDGDTLQLGLINGIEPEVGTPINLLSGATVMLLPDGTVNYIPGDSFTYLDGGETEIDTFTYTVIDDDGNVDIAVVSVTLEGNDQISQTAPDEGEVTPSETVSVDVLINDFDEDQSDNPLVVDSVSVDSGSGTVTTNGEQVFFDPGSDFDDLDEGESATVIVTYVVETPDGDAPVSENVTITVNGVNDAPDAVDDGVSTNEGGIVDILALENDNDPDSSDSLTITGVTNPAVGAVNFSDTEISYDQQEQFNHLAAGETATVNFSYNISDGGDGTDTANVGVTIDGQNDGPTANDNQTSTFAESPITIDVLTNDSDPDTTDVLTITDVEQPSSGTVTFTDGNLTFDPLDQFIDLGEDESTTVTFTYDISDGNGGVDTAAVTVTINGGNDIPEATDDEGETEENAPIVVASTENDSDPDGDPLTITSVDQPASGGTATFTDTEVTFNPLDDFDNLADGESATVTFTYEVADGNGGTDIATVTVTVNGENDAPNAIDDSVVTVVDENTPVVVASLTNDTDPESDTLTITEVSIPQGGGTATFSDTEVTFDPLDDFDELGEGETATVTFSYEISDGHGGSDTATVTITVNGENDIPDAIDDEIEIAENTATVVASLTNDSDPESDQLTITSVDQLVGGGVATFSDTEVIFDPGSDFDSLREGESATVTFTYDISDGNDGSDTATVTVTINGENDAPVAVDDNAGQVETEENTPLVVASLSNDSDPESDTLTITDVTQPAVGSASFSDTEVTFDPQSAFDYLAVGESATVIFTYEISDGEGGSDSATVTVTVNGENDDPTALDDNAQALPDSPVTILSLGNDIEVDGSDVLTITGVTQPSGGGTVTFTEDDITFDPLDQFVGLEEGETATVIFTYNLSDGNGGTDAASVTVTVNGGNDAPVAVDDDAGETGENTPILVASVTNDTDPEGDQLTITEVSDPGVGAVTFTNTDITFDPQDAFDGLAVGESEIVTFTYNISDGGGGVDTATVTVTINGEDDAPDANDDIAQTTESASIVVASLDNDIDPESDPLTITGVSDPVVGTATFTDTDVTFDPLDAFEGLAVGETATVTFAYNITDGQNGVDTATVTVTINGENDGPDAVDDNAGTAEHEPIVVASLGNDTDPDGDDLTITGVGDPGLGSVTFTDNDVTYDPGDAFNDLGANESVTVTFTYDISDGEDGVDTATVTVTINGENDGPDAVDDNAGTTEHAPVVVASLSNDTDPDGDDLTITGVGDPGVGSVSFTANDVTYDPGDAFNDLGANESATVTFTYDISDGQNGVDTATVTVTINGENDGPGAIDDNAGTAEHEPIVVASLENDTDPDGDDLTITGVGDPGLGSVTFTDNDVTYDPGDAFNDLGANESATVTFTYDISDGQNGVDTATVTVTINGENDGPDAFDDNAGTAEHEPIVVASLSNDTDPDSDDLTITGVGDPGLGSVTFTANDVTYDPGDAFNDLGANESATVTFTYDISDGEDGVDTATVTVTINGENDGPDAVDDNAGTAEHEPIVVASLGNDTDPDGDDLTITGVGDPGLGSVIFTDNDVTYDPGDAFNDLGANESATVTFTYDISDGEDGVDTATVTVTINGENDGPDAVDDNAGTAEHEPIVVASLGNDTDPDGDDLTITGVGDPGLGSVTFTDNDVTYDPGDAFNDLGANESATVTFTYYISDGQNGVDTATVTVTINGENDGPDAVDDNAGTAEHEPIVVASLSNDTDPDGDDLTITGVGDPGLGSVTFTDNDVTYDPGDAFNDLGEDESATVTFTYDISDGEEGVDTATVTVTINGENDGPDAVDDNAGTAEHEPIVVASLSNDTDPDGDDLTITGVGDPGLGSVTFTDNDVTYDPSEAFNDLGVNESATVTFTYDISDGEEGVDTATVTVTINGENDGPDAVDDNAGTAEHAPVVVASLGNDIDPDGDDLTITGVGDPGVGSVSFTANDVTYDPGDAFNDLGANESATVTFTYDISDGQNGVDTATVTVTINGENDGPNAVDDNAGTTEHAPIVVASLGNDTDPDGDDLTITGVGDPGVGSVSFTANDVTYDPGDAFNDLGANESATVTFTYDISDGEDGVDTATVTVTINGENDGPDAIDDNAGTTEHEPIVVASLGNDTDPDGDDLTITGVGDPGLGSVTFTDNDVTYDPGDAFDDLGANESATVTFTYDISDGQNGVDTATVTVTINGENDGPDAVDDNVETTEHAPIVVASLANDTDPDNDDLTITGVSDPGVGAVTFTGDDVTFDPEDAFNDLGANESATVTFTYNITDGEGDVDTATVTVTINGENDGPDAIDDNVSATGDAPIVVASLGNDTDPDGDDLTITGVGDPSVGSVTFTANDVTYDPGDAFNDLGEDESATVTFTYDISDGQNGVDTATVTVTINGENDGPDAVDDNAGAAEHEPIVVASLSNDTDPDGDDLTITGVGDPGLGSVTFTDNDVTYDPGDAFNDLGANESATVTFTYDISDGEEGVDTATVTVTINGENDGPDAFDDNAGTTEHAPIVVASLGNDTDPDGDDLTITGVGDPGLGSVTFTDNDVTYDPGDAFNDLGANESATVTFTYDISDGGDGVDTATVTVTINGENDGPGAIDDNAGTAEHEPIVVASLSNDTDPDGDDLTITGVGDPGLGSVTFTDNDVTYDPGDAFNDLGEDESATVTFTYDISDGEDGVDTATVTVTINGENDGPDALMIMQGTTEHAPIVVASLGNDTDPDGDDLTITGVGDPGLGSVTFTDNDVTYDPGDAFNDLGANESAPVTFTYNISDGQSGVDTATVTVTINGENDAPSATNDIYTIDEGATLVTSVLDGVLVNDGSDPDGDSLS